MKQEYENFTDQQIWDYEEKLKENEIEKQEYISKRFPLEHECSQNISILNKKLETLCESYGYVRRTRRDGNCFYRAVGFSILEHVFKYREQEDFEVFFVNRMKLYLESAGFQKLVYEDLCWNVIHECLKYLSTINSSDTFLDFFNQSTIADSIVVLLRLTTSAYLRLNSEEFLPFVENYSSMDEFCATNVENMGKDADHVHITALSKALDLVIYITYLDAHIDTECFIHIFKGESSSLFQAMYLLYRPGHYDILEKRE